MRKAITEESNMTYTENGAVTYLSTGSACLDLFATVGALRGAEDAEIAKRFLRAFAEDADTAMKLLFFARDIRGGLGERRVFRTMLRWLAKHEPDSVRKNMTNIAEYGRYDDLMTLLGTPAETAMVETVKAQLEKDLSALHEGKPVSLLAKWLPSVNASNAQTVRQAKYMARSLGMRQQEYRRMLSRLRRAEHILENHLRERDYSFAYAAQPSKAMLKYRDAFMRNDKERYEEFLHQVAEGRATLHTGTLLPYDIVAQCLPPSGWFGETRKADFDRQVLDTTWNALEDFTRGENALVVVDGSGSMYGTAPGAPMPAAVAMSLGIYFAEHNRGLFHDCFITFSQRPKLVEIKGRDIVEKVRYCEQYNEVANTDLQRVFDLILCAAVKKHATQEELPSTLYIISDMEFDCCMENAGQTNFECAREKFAAAGYELPRVVFWNVSCRHEQQPVRANEQGAALVSGASPRLFSWLMSGAVTPLSYMQMVLESERYRGIVA